MKTLKTLALILAGALMFVGCEGGSGEGNNAKPKFVLEFDDAYIYNNGEDYAVISASFNGEVLDYSEYIIFDQNDEMVEWPIVDGEMRFTSTTVGKYRFEAIYGSYKASTSIEVVQTPPAWPEEPVDNNQSKLNFTRRVLLTQFTGTACQFCPYMVNTLHELNDAKKAGTGEYLYKDKIVITAAHVGDYASSDPARLMDALNIDSAFGVVGYPDIVIDMASGHPEKPFYANVEPLVKSALNRTKAKAGIAVNTLYYEEENYVVVSAKIKAAESGEFRIGAWLLEDNVYGSQTINSSVPKRKDVDYNYHNNCIRRARVSRRSSMDYTGLDPKGGSWIEKGNYAVQEFAFPLKKHGEKGGAEQWNHNNLRVVVFVTTKEGDKWCVNNVVKAPKHGSVDFEYTE